MVYLYFGVLILINLATLIAAIKNTLKENKIMIDLTALTAEVAKVGNVADSAVTFIQGLSAQLKAVPQSTDSTTQAALDSLTSQLDAKATELSNAIATPAAASVTVTTPASTSSATTSPASTPSTTTTPVASSTAATSASTTTPSTSPVSGSTPVSGS